MIFLLTLILTNTNADTCSSKSMMQCIQMCQQQHQSQWTSSEWNHMINNLKEEYGNNKLFTTVLDTMRNASPKDFNMMNVSAFLKDKCWKNSNDIPKFSRRLTYWLSRFMNGRQETRSSRSPDILSKYMGEMVAYWYVYPSVRPGRDVFEHRKSEIRTNTVEMFRRNVLSFTGALLTNKQFEPHLNRIMQQHGPSIAKSSYCRRRSKRQNIPFQGQDSWPDNDDTLQRTNRNWLDDDIERIYGVSFNDCNDSSTTKRKGCTDGQRYKAAIHRRLIDSFGQYDHIVTYLLADNTDICDSY